MTQTGSQDLGWAERWGVVRLVREKLKFVAFFGVDPVRWTVCRLGRFRLVEHLRLIGDRR